MKQRFFLIGGFLFIVAFSSGQNKDPQNFFHASKQVCHLYWVSGYDYAIKLYGDSTASYIFYESEYKGGANKISRKEFKGKYSIHGDTVQIQYLYSTESKKGNALGITESSFRDTPSLGTVVETKKPTIIKQVDAPAGITLQKDWFNAPAKFILRNKTMMPLEGSTPSLITSSLVEMETLEKIFSSWNNNLNRFQ